MLNSLAVCCIMCAGRHNFGGLRTKAGGRLLNKPVTLSSFERACGGEVCQPFRCS
jgi:hypothetical protein